MKSNCKDTTLLGSFLENHDRPRFPSITSDRALNKNAIGFTMLSDGMPIIYQGQEQYLSGSAVPNNREAIWLSGYSTTADLYTFITTINKLRTQAIAKDTTYVTYKASPVFSDSSTIVMRKGATGSQLVSVFSNTGASGAHSFQLTASASGFTASLGLTEVLACKTYTTDSNGALTVGISGGLPQVFYPSAQLSGSGLCPNTTVGSSSSSASSAVSSCKTFWRCLRTARQAPC